MTLDTDGKAMPPLIAHIVNYLGVGGLENGVVNLINHIPRERYRHAIICLEGHSDFHRRLTHEDVPLYSLNKREGNDSKLLWRVWHLLRKIRPALVHTRNLNALESILPATLAGVSRRVHGEHGWDMHDLHGSKRRYHWLRFILFPLIHRFITVSRGLESYLVERVKVPPNRVVRICNGVDTDLFHPRLEVKEPLPVDGFCPPGAIVVGWVGRMTEVKDPLTLARAFVRLVAILPEVKGRLRLVMLGPGPLHSRVKDLLEESGVASMSWIPGTRDDVPAMLRSMDIFVLPSLAEGISNTILESMASGLPVVATRVGGNPELVEDGVTGTLVPTENLDAIAAAVAAYVEDETKRKSHARAARERAVREFGLGCMVDGYLSVYDALLAKE